MKNLILGASGATGKRLVEELLKVNQEVKIIVRSTNNIPSSWLNNSKIEVIVGNTLEMSKTEITEHLKDCHSVSSCLGHRLSFKGIYGHPRKLVRDSVKIICESIKTSPPSHPIKFILMNTSGNANRDINESIPLKNKIVIGLLRLLLPPHPDNEKAADYLRINVGQNNTNIQWVAVRPDGLIDQDTVTKYKAYPSPVRNPIFNAGKTSCINVAHFMSQLITEEQLWKRWKGQMPVIYNSDSL